MTPKFVILSGPIGAGKTTLATMLCERYGLTHFKSREYLRQLESAHPVALERRAMQNFGDLQDRRTGGRWIVDGIERLLSSTPGVSCVVVDCVRIQKQIDAIRTAYGLGVVHVHLTAPDEELERRYLERPHTSLKERSSYKDARMNRTERLVDRLSRDADAVIDTSLNREVDVVIRVASHLGLYGREYLRLVDVLIGGQYGSEGKGQVAAYLAREYDILVRVGGPNAGHTVHLGNGKKTYHHLPSGTLSSSASLVIAPGAVINVDGILREIGDCDIEAKRLAIDPQVMTISCGDIQSERGLQRAIGSTKQGVGYATARRITGRGGRDVRLARDVKELRPYVRDTCEILERAFNDHRRVLLEGTQGTGLSLYHGSYPHVTSRDTTVAGCLAEAGISPSRVRKVVMVCRTYPIRVQSPKGKGRSSGFMSQETTWEVIAQRAHLDLEKLKAAEKTSTTKRDRRVSEFDWELLRKSASLNAPTDVALTFADYLDIKNESAHRFDQLTAESLRFIEEVERVAAAPVSLISTRFHTRSIIDRRAW